MSVSRVFVFLLGRRAKVGAAANAANRLLQMPRGRRNRKMYRHCSRETVASSDGALRAWVGLVPCL